MQSEFNLVESVPAPEVFFTHVARITLVETCVRFTLTQRRSCIYTGRPEDVVVARLVVPITALGPALFSTMQFAASQAVPGDWEAIIPHIRASTH